MGNSSFYCIVEDAYLLRAVFAVCEEKRQQLSMKTGGKEREKGRKGERTQTKVDAYFKKTATF